MGEPGVVDAAAAGRDTVDPSAGPRAEPRGTRTRIPGVRLVRTDRTVVRVPPRRPGRSRAPRVRAVVVDLVAAGIAALVGLALRFGLEPPTGTHVTVVVLAALLPVGWVLVVGACRGYEPRLAASGTVEHARLLRAFWVLTVAVAVVSYATDLGLARGFVAVALPATLALTLVGRAGISWRVRRARAHGKVEVHAVVVGPVDAALDLLHRLQGAPAAGIRVVGLSAPVPPTDAETVALCAAGLPPAVGSLDALAADVRRLGADTVVVAAGLGSARLRALAWSLERLDVALVVDPGVIEVTGRRLQVRPVSGLPLLHVDQPRFDGWHRAVKDATDRVLALLGLVVLAPLLLAIALAVRLDSPGPALFRQTRIGVGGRTFRVVKFRSMHVDAEARRAELVAANINADGLLFKVRQDPRITRVGRWLRRCSLDEVPQLLNVLSGSMSLVGPRPPLPDEVELYDATVRRRLLVKPGMTGLWQVSGRSDLSWEESVRLDLRYVENWSPALDLSILLRTVVAVVTARGAM